jgi:uncharacterized membrane protein
MPGYPIPRSSECSGWVGSRAALLRASTTMMLALGVIVAALAPTSAGAEIPPSYRVTLLPLEVSNASNALNDLGQVVGVDPSGMQVLYSPGIGSRRYGDVVGAPQSLSNQGLVTGRSPASAYLYSPISGLTVVPQAEAGFDVNDQGEVVGYVRAGGSNHASYYSSERGPLDIHSGAGSSYAWAINDAGTVVGLGSSDEGGTYAFVYTRSLGMQAVDASFGYGTLFNINERGIAVGDFGSSGIDHQPVVYDTNTGELRFLPRPSFGDGVRRDSQTRGINDYGQVTGAIVDPDNFYQGFLYDPDADKTVLLQSLVDPSLGMHIAEGLDINNRGEILVGAFTDQSGPAYYLLTPIPEPATVLLFIAGLVLFAPFVRSTPQSDSESPEDDGRARGEAAPNQSYSW